MPRLEACLLDAYDTIVHTDFIGHRDELSALAADLFGQRVAVLGGLAGQPP